MIFLILIQITYSIVDHLQFGECLAQCIVQCFGAFCFHAQQERLLIDGLYRHYIPEIIDVVILANEPFHQRQQRQQALEFVVCSHFNGGYISDYFRCFPALDCTCGGGKGNHLFPKHQTYMLCVSTFLPFTDYLIIQSRKAKSSIFGQVFFKKVLVSYFFRSSMFPSKSNRSNFFLAYFCPFSIIFLSLLGLPRPCATNEEPAFCKVLCAGSRRLAKRWLRKGGFSEKCLAETFFAPYLCIRQAAARQLKQVLLHSPCTIFALTTTQNIRYIQFTEALQRARLYFKVKRLWNRSKTIWTTRRERTRRTRSQAVSRCFATAFSVTAKCATARSARSFFLSLGWLRYNRLDCLFFLLTTSMAFWLN